MIQRNYRRTFEELEAVASKFWPSKLSEMEAELSIIPLLIDTHQQFINILSLDVINLESLFIIINESSISANLFLKHLVILTDFGGEMLNRVSREFNSLFPTGQLNYYWKGNECSYQFKMLPNRALSNQNLEISGKKLLKKHPLKDGQKDAIAL